MTDLRNTMDPGPYALGYESGFAAGRAKGVEESWRCAAGKNMVQPSPIGALHGAGWNGAVQCIVEAIRSLIPTGDAEKGEVAPKGNK